MKRRVLPNDNQTAGFPDVGLMHGDLTGDTGQRAEFQVPTGPGTLNLGHPQMVDVSPGATFDPTRPDLVRFDVDPRGGHNLKRELHRLRAALPFVPIMVTPHNVRNVLLAVAGKPAEIIIPDNAELAQWHGSDLFYISFQGNAELPSQNADTSGYLNTTSEVASIMVPVGRSDLWYYVRRQRAISVIAPNPNVVVSVSFIQQAD